MVDRYCGINKPTMSAGILIFDGFPKTWTQLICKGKVATRMQQLFIIFLVFMLALAMAVSSNFFH